jgi:hypothetical protein
MFGFFGSKSKEGGHQQTSSTITEIINFATVFDNLPDYTILVRADGRILSANAAFRRTFPLLLPGAESPCFYSRCFDELNLAKLMRLSPATQLPAAISTMTPIGGK